MSKKDLVRDGRLQAPKKRTDRSYLKTSSAPAAVAEPEAIEADAAEAEALDAAAIPAAEPVIAAAAPVAAAAAVATPAPAPVASVRAAAPSAAPKSGAARALEQQGVRKRRELDVDALAKRDSEYAKHELRRIAMFAGVILAALVLIAIFVV